MAYEYMHLLYAGGIVRGDDDVEVEYLTNIVAKFHIIRDNGILLYN